MKFCWIWFYTIIYRLDVGEFRIFFHHILVAFRQLRLTVWLQLVWQWSLIVDHRYSWHSRQLCWCWRFWINSICWNPTYGLNTRSLFCIKMAGVERPLKSLRTCNSQTKLIIRLFKLTCPFQKMVPNHHHYSKACGKL